MNVPITMPEHWEVEDTPWDCLIGQVFQMDGGTGTVTGVEVDPVARVFTVSLV